MPKINSKSCKAYLLDIFFPNRCPFCNEIIKWDNSVCDECRNKIINACEKICHKCGNVNCVCDGTKSYDNAYAAVFFDDENVSGAVYEFKRLGMINLAEYTAETVCRYIDNADFVTGVPMGKRKQKSRGHNQADILARCIGEYLDIPFVNNLVCKIDTKDEQHHFSEEERKERVKDLFYCCNYDLSGKTVVLCDDVMTTGSTVDRCAELLKEMGAAKVIVCVCAVTRFDKSQEEG